MSGYTITKYLLSCDGCGTQRPEADTAIEARGCAYADGWRFPARAKANGSPSSTASDVCPKCLPGWATQATRRRGGPRRRDGV